MNHSTGFEIGTRKNDTFCYRHLRICGGSEWTSAGSSNERAYQHFSNTVSIISEKLGSPAKTHDRGNP